MHINAKDFNSGLFVNSASYMYNKVLGKVPVYTILVLLMLSSFQFVILDVKGDDPVKLGPSIDETFREIQGTIETWPTPTPYER